MEADFTWPTPDGFSPPHAPAVATAPRQRRSRPRRQARAPIDVTPWGIYKREVSRRRTTLDAAAAFAGLNSFDAAERLQREHPKLYERAVRRTSSGPPSSRWG